MKWCMLLIFILVQHHLNDADEMLIRKKRVIGGYLSPEGLFPFIASIRINKFGHFVHFCGGAIISERYILSSAHCMLLQSDMKLTCYHGKYVDQPSIKWDLIAVVGTNKLKHDDGIVYPIESYIYHSNFSFKLGVNDISLLRTSKVIFFDKYVKPIALYNKHVEEGSTVVVPGWGLTSYPGDPSNNLKFLDLKMISSEECAKYWKKTYKSQICTFTTSGEGVCTSDSGGPLIYKGELIGLVSFGKPCAVGYPDVFTNVTHMHKWIVNNIECLNGPDF